MVKVVFKEARTSFLSNTTDICGLQTEISDKYNIPPNSYYLTTNGKLLQNEFINNPEQEIQLVLSIFGGKGGFGSMLRAIGAQIEKTTNREACRDLSGRRLRDINEEKRLKAWLEKQKNQDPKDLEEKFKRKIEKLLAKPKKEFKDEDYDSARSNLLDNISDSFEQGLKAARGESSSTCTTTTSTVVETERTILSSVGLKRKVPEDNSQKKNAKKIKGALWIDEGISSCSDSDSDDDDNNDDSSEYEKGESSGSNSNK
ncbi:hypothetical protein PVAND_001344 [Polypedilum vanderplanki]|uniref:SDE2-like domain-containing protein n=1 Tax=Polypedilum vanderplanki TaxID=319348 RepID=A0A9J6BMY1_POLVA|nr:hypothetical protein PVAND_001344 [Polypedilum vanderplanki]